MSSIKCIYPDGTSYKQVGVPYTCDTAKVLFFSLGGSINLTLPGEEAKTYFMPSSLIVPAGTRVNSLGNNYQLVGVADFEIKDIPID